MVFTDFPNEVQISYKKKGGIVHGAPAIVGFAEGQCMQPYLGMRTGCSLFWTYDNPGHNGSTLLFALSLSKLALSFYFY